MVHVTRRNPPDSQIVAEQMVITFDTRRTSRARLQAFAEEANGDTQSNRLVADGVPFDEIAKKADWWESDIILIATHGYTGLKYALQGSTAERVVRHAPCPVLVMRTRQIRGVTRAFSPDRVQSILVPVDYSESSLVALQHALALARTYTARLCLLHLIAPFHANMCIDTAKSRREARMAAHQNPAKLSGVTWQLWPRMGRELRPGTPVATIAAMAKRTKADIIVMDTHGRTGLKGAPIGSVVEGVVRCAPCSWLSVLTVRTANTRGRSTGIFESPGAPTNPENSRRRFTHAQCRSREPLESLPDASHRTPLRRPRWRAFRARRGGAGGLGPGFHRHHRHHRRRFRHLQSGTVGRNRSGGGRPEISLGDALGSNVVNVALILAVVLRRSKISYPRASVRRDFPVALLVPVAVGALRFDDQLSRADGVALLAFFFAWLALVISFAVKERSAAAGADAGGHLLVGEQLAGGLAFLVGSGFFIVKGARAIAVAHGIPEFVIGATVVAVGASMSELATTVISQLRGHDDIGLGAILGSDVFNGPFIVGMAAVICSIRVDLGEVAWVLGFRLLTTIMFDPRRVGLIPSSQVRGLVGNLRGLRARCAAQVGRQRPRCPRPRSSQSTARFTMPPWMRILHRPLLLPPLRPGDGQFFRPSCAR